MDENKAYEDIKAVITTKKIGISELSAWYNQFKEAYKEAEREEL